ncbi:mandelate racemase/muconate lactonizing enzyme family protein [Kiloniella sp.]|uniref:mandelate racemase/muconate lactonizing enzyme family protein n=1 Tax=Kiloniella sp. TaxID=1938587 RepID=UPI003B01D595
MRISEIHIYQHDLPVMGVPYRMARTTVDKLDSTIVEIVTDTGLVGYGETCPVGPVYQPQHAMGARAALFEMAPNLIGENPLLIDNVRLAMDETLNGHNYAKAAIDIALWDITGKAYGARVCDLLGGAQREKVPSYYACGVNTPEESARVAFEKKREGYTRLQIKVGGRPIEEDIAVIRKVSEVINPGVRLAIDGNRGWTTRDTLLVSMACEDIPFIMEQPCNTYEEIQSIRHQVRHPIYLDENTEDLNVVLRAISDGVCDGFGFKVTRLGGISAFRTIRDICRVRSMPHTCDDAWGGDIIAAACTHIGATVLPSLCEGVWIAAPYIDGNYDQANGINITDGWIDVPKGPGLGINPERGVWGNPVNSFV